MKQQDRPREFERRTFLKRAGVVAGATVWATPTIQSIGSAAFATGTDAVCDTYISFKIEVIGDKSGVFVAPSDDNKGDCQPDVCDQADFKVPAGGTSSNAAGFTFTIVQASDEQATIRISAPQGGSIESVNVKAKTGGGNAGPDTCKDALPEPTSTIGKDFVELKFVKPGKGAGLSNFAGCICVTLPPV